MQNHARGRVAHGDCPTGCSHSILANQQWCGDPIRVQVHGHWGPMELQGEPPMRPVVRPRVKSHVRAAVFVVVVVVVVVARAVIGCCLILPMVAVVPVVVVVQLLLLPMKTMVVP